MQIRKIYYPKLNVSVGLIVPNGNYFELGGIGSHLAFKKSPSEIFGCIINSIINTFRKTLVNITVPIIGKDNIYLCMDKINIDFVLHFNRIAFGNICFWLWFCRVN